MKYNTHNNSRIKSYGFVWMTTFEYDLWWDHTNKRWGPLEELEGPRISSSRPCKSLRAFRRMLKQAPKGVRFILVNRYGIKNNIDAFNIEATSK